MSNQQELDQYINLKLAALGQPTNPETADSYFQELVGPLLRNFHQKDLLLHHRLCPADSRIQEFLDSYLSDICPAGAPRLPAQTFVIDRPGLARALSFPPAVNSFHSPYLDSYRISQGVLHNPRATAARRKGYSTSPRAGSRSRPIRSPFPKRSSSHCSTLRCALRKTC